MQTQKDSYKKSNKYKTKEKLHVYHCQMQQMYQG